MDTKKLLLCILISCVATSCDKLLSEIKGSKEPIPYVELNLSYEIDEAKPEFFVTVECDAKNGTSAAASPKNKATTRSTESMVQRCIIDLYRVYDDQRIFEERKVVWMRDAEEVKFNLTPYEYYTVLAWCDLVEPTGDDYIYDSSDLHNIRYRDIELKDNNNKECFTNVTTIDLREYKESDEKVINRSITLTRPMARYRCITTDINDYIGKDNTTSKITTVATYVQNVAAGYNVEEQKPNYFESTRTYISTVSTDDLDEDGSLEMCYDYLFVDSKQTNVKINFQFYKGVVKMVDGVLTREDGKEVTEDDRISNWSGIVVPLKRNMETVIEGRLLTASFGS